MLQLDRIQSEALRGYPHIGDRAPREAFYLFLDGDRPSLLKFIKNILPKITTVATWQPEASVNLALSYRGLARVAPEINRELATFENEQRGKMPLVLTPPPALEDLLAFREGMASRAASRLGDDGDSAPEHWEFGRAESGAFALLMMVQGTDHDAVKAAREAVLGAATTAELTLQREERGVRLWEGRENFGFLDGIGQPAVEGMATGPKQIEGFGVVTPEGTWRALKAGEIVLGYEDERGPFVGFEDLRDSTFIALRKLEQHTDVLDRWLRDKASQESVTEAAERDHEDPVEWLAARLVGRRRADGSALVLPKGSGPDNTFRFALDPNGFGCPHAAHVRRVNPRDALNRFGDRAERHRMMRRGTMYAEQRVNGEWRQDSKLAPDDRPAIHDKGLHDSNSDRRRGMLFLAFGASLVRQFEFVQGNWINDGGAARGQLFEERDPLVGGHAPGSGRLIVPHVPSVVADGVRLSGGGAGPVPSAVGAPEPHVGLNRFVTTRGGAYFLLPSLTLLGRVLDGRTLIEAKAGVSTDVLVQGSTLRSFAQVTSMPMTQAPALGGSSLQFSGAHTLSQLLGVAPEPPSPVGTRPDPNAPAPETQLVQMLVPVRDKNQLLVDLRRRDHIDAVLGAVTVDGRQLIHHARLTHLESLPRPSPDPEHPTDLRHGALDLTQFNPAGYLLFLCRFDGTRAAFIDALAIALQGKSFVFDACHGSWGTPIELAASFDLYGFPTAFLHRAHRETNSLVQKALRLRGAFLDAMSRLPSRTPNEGRIMQWFEEFLRDHGSDLEQ